MGSGGTCHHCKRYTCMCGTLDKLKVLRVIDEEEEFEGEIPDTISDPEEALRMAVRLTKRKIRERIEEL